MFRCQSRIGSWSFHSVLACLACFGLMFVSSLGDQTAQAQEGDKNIGRAGGAEPEVGQPSLVLEARGHTAMVNKLLFSRDGKELISVSADKTIRVWDVFTGEPLRVLRPPIGIGNEGMLYAAALSPDGTTLAVGGYGWNSGDQPIYLLSLATGRIERVLTGHENVILGLSFDAEGKRLISGSGDSTARIWNVGTGKTEQVLRGHTKGIYGVTFSPDGRRCATGSNDHTAAVWSVATGERLATLTGHTAVVRCLDWSRNGETLATGSFDHTIRLWNMERVGNPSTKTFDKLGEHNIVSVRFTADGQRLLYTQNYGTTGKLIAAILDVTTGREVARFDQHSNTIMDGVLSPDGTLAATTGGNDNETFLWKTADGTRVQKLVSRGHANFAAAWSPDGTRIAWGNTANGTDTISAKQPLERTFELATLEFAAAPDERFVRARPERGSLSLAAGKPNDVGNINSVLVRQGEYTLATIQMTDPYEQIRSATLLPNDWVAFGTNYNLYLYEARTGKELRTFQGHTGVIWAVSPSPDGRLLLSAAGDMTLRVWDPNRDEPLCSCFFAGDDWIVWTPEGYYAASPGGESLMGWHIHRGKDQMADYYAASQFRKRFYRPDVIKLLLKSGSVERALEVAGEKPAEIAQSLPPKIRFLAPTGASEVTRAELTVRAAAKSQSKHPITAMKLLLNGRPYLGQVGTKNIVRSREVTAADEIEESWTITLEPGAHRITIQAETAVSDGLSDELRVTFRPPQAPAEPSLPSLYLLSIGVSKYDVEKLKLNYAARDARKLDETLRQRSASLFRKVETKVLTDEQATQTGIRKGLGWLRSQMTQFDVGIVFYSGHGAKDRDSTFYLLPVDTDPNDLLTTGIPDSLLKSALAGVPGRVLLILDACHAGATDGDRRKAPTSITDDLVRDLVNDDYGVIVMASSMGREYSMESDEHQLGFFTLALTEGLLGKADGNNDQTVYLNELDEYVSTRVKELTKGAQHPVTSKPTSIRSFPIAKQ